LTNVSTYALGLVKNALLLALCADFFVLLQRVLFL